MALLRQNIAGRDCYFIGFNIGSLTVLSQHSKAARKQRGSAARLASIMFLGTQFLGPNSRVPQRQLSEHRVPRGRRAAMTIHGIHSGSYSRCFMHSGNGR